MADSFIWGEDEVDEFFDSRDDISAGSSSCPGSPVYHDSFPTENLLSIDPRNHVWSGRMSSVQERRYNFMKWMGLDRIHDANLYSVTFNPDGEIKEDGETMSDIGRKMSDGGAVLKVTDEGLYGPKFGVMKENMECISTNFDDDNLGNDGSVRRFHKTRSNRMITIDALKRRSSPSSSIQQSMLKEDNTLNNCNKVVRRRSRIGWLKRLGIAACIVDRHGEESNSCLSNSDYSGSASVQRIKVRSYKKRIKEFSAVYMEQDIKAHNGAILAMKFSLDGKHLASGGDDEVVCVWRVIEFVKTEEGDVPKDDSSCIYFTVKHNYAIDSLCRNKEKNDKLRSMKTTSDRACVIIPPDIFRLSENPLHIFRGHNGFVLDLSWSNNKYLLSSSTDKTVRLWRVGCDSCLKVFSHNNYVTCIQFNPVHEEYFVSGAIDGKVRVWEIPSCQVVDWINVKQIVTALCYRPDGKCLVVGFMSGDCQYYDATDNHLQLDVQISSTSKKKFPYKRITGIQFSPSDHRKVMISSADSHIRILDGVNVICKCRGLRIAGGQMSASFTSDGRHIISASEDSYVYIWNYTNRDSSTSNRVKSTWSCEHFFSSNASVAIPWHVLESRNPLPVSHSNSDSRANSMRKKSSSTVSRGFFSDLLPKGSATWPEEKLLLSSMATDALSKSDYKSLMSSCQSVPHAWGRVIVTAGWDGRIRSYQNYGLPVNM